MTTLNSYPQKYTRGDDLKYLVTGALGSSIGQQMDDIMKGEPLEEQNPNALKAIAEFLEYREPAIAKEIEEYLSK